jgi:GNAT superfamily N-acetyltransferase
MISIRCVVPAEAGDLSRIALAAKRQWGYPERWMQIWAPQLTFTPEYFEMNPSWVAELEGDPIAFYTLLEKGGTAWIENMWVLPQYIGKGVGKQLFHHALSYARERGWKSLQLEAEPNAAGFYEKMGMRKIGETSYELDGRPRILPIMEMIL